MCCGALVQETLDPQDVKKLAVRALRPGPLQRTGQQLFTGAGMRLNTLTEIG